jgi:Arc/MetJ-type ribon-helix-helix transcriptional regulator
MSEKLYINLNIRFPEWIVSKIDEKVYANGYGNRSDLIRDLVKKGVCDE